MFKLMDKWFVIQFNILYKKYKYYSLKLLWDYINYYNFGFSNLS